MKPYVWLQISLILLTLPGFLWAQPGLHLDGVRGLVLLAEHRFDPAVQRFIAERELAALPLRDGELYYVFPMHQSNAQIEHAQIRYLESMIARREKEDGPDRAE